MDTSFAFTINQAAGWHAIPSDPREVEAARRASERSVREVPYYVERYGERGRSFGHSDSAWLITLCERGFAEVVEQVLWLGVVLSSRGMPRLLLERHLEILHDELLRAFPKRPAQYEPLREVADLLGDLRRARLSDPDLHALDEAFAARAGRARMERLPGFGSIVAAAALDEEAGIGKAVESLTTWATDEKLFPPAWIEAVHATLRETRSRLRPSDDEEIVAERVGG